MKQVALSQYFHRQFKKLSTEDQEKTCQALKKFSDTLREHKMPAGFGFKKIGEDKYEMRVDIRIRIAMKLDHDILVCHCVGNHDDIRKYLKEYR